MQNRKKGSIFYQYLSLSMGFKKHFVVFVFHGKIFKMATSANIPQSTPLNSASSKIIRKQSSAKRRLQSIIKSNLNPSIHGKFELQRSRIAWYSFRGQKIRSREGNVRVIETLQFSLQICMFYPMVATIVPETSLFFEDKARKKWVPDAPIVQVLGKKMVQRRLF